MKKIKSALFTILISGGVFGVLYFVSIEKKVPQNIEPKHPSVTLEEELLGVREEEKVEVLPIILPESIKEEKVEEKIEEAGPETVVNEKKEVENHPKKENIVKKEEKRQDKKTEEIKEDKKLKSPQKESKIGVDRKLISGIPGTLNYKGKFPTHNVKEKGSITISYTVDKSGNVISAYRIAGLRGRNVINNAITLVKKYVKAEKSKTNSTGTYTIVFK